MEGCCAVQCFKPLKSVNFENCHILNNNKAYMYVHVHTASEMFFKGGGTKYEAP